MAKLAEVTTTTDVRGKMEALAHFVMRMTPEEIRAFLDALLPSMDEDEKEDLYGLLVFEQRRGDAGGRTVEEVFADIEGG